MRWLPIPLLLVLAACGGESGEDEPVTQSEARALDEAAEMVEQTRPPEPLPAADAAPAPRSTR